MAPDMADFISMCERLLDVAKVRRLTVPEVMPIFLRFKEMGGNEVGGSLHVVLDGGNVKDWDVGWCVGYAEEKGDVVGKAFGRVLLELSRTQRRKLSARFYGLGEGE